MLKHTHTQSTHDLQTLSTMFHLLVRRKTFIKTYKSHYKLKENKCTKERKDENDTAKKVFLKNPAPKNHSYDLVSMFCVLTCASCT